MKLSKNNKKKGGMPWLNGRLCREISVISGKKIPKKVLLRSTNYFRPINRGYNLQFHPLLSLLATSPGDLSTKFWHLRPDGSLDETPVAILNDNHFVSFHPTLPFFATTDLDDTVNLWQISPDYSLIQTYHIYLQNEKPPHIRNSEYRSTSKFTSLVFHPIHNILVIAYSIFQHIDDDSYPFSRISCWLKCIRFRPDGTVDPAHSNLVRSIHGYDISSLSFNPEGTILATTSLSTRTVLSRFSLEGAGSIPTIQNDILAEFVNIFIPNTYDYYIKYPYGCEYPLYVKFHPRGLLLSINGCDNTVQFYQLKPDGSAVDAKTPFTSIDHNDFVISVTFHPKLPIVATANKNNTVKLWRFNSKSYTYECIETLTGHTDEVTSVDFNHDGTLLATGSNDGTAKLWDCSKVYGYLRIEALTRAGLSSRLIKAFTTEKSESRADLRFSNAAQDRIGNPPDLPNSVENRERLVEILRKKYPEFPRAEALALSPMVASQPVLPSHAAAAIEFPDVSSVCRVDDKECNAVYDSTFWDIVKEMHKSCTDSSEILKKLEELKRYSALLIEQGKPPGITSIWIKKLEKKISGCPK